MVSLVRRLSPFVPGPRACTKYPSTIILRAISNNPEEYPDPEKFQPERYLGSQPALDPGTYVFGVGRRVCAGRDLADANVFLYAATLLATSNLRKSIRADGTVVEPEAVFEASAVVLCVLLRSIPCPFGSSSPCLFQGNQAVRMLC